MVNRIHKKAEPAPLDLDINEAQAAFERLEPKLRELEQDQLLSIRIEGARRKSRRADVAQTRAAHCRGRFALWIRSSQRLHRLADRRARCATPDAATTSAARCELRAARSTNSATRVAIANCSVSSAMGVLPRCQRPSGHSADSRPGRSFSQLQLRREQVIDHRGHGKRRRVGWRGQSDTITKHGAATLAPKHRLCELPQLRRPRGDEHPEQRGHRISRTDRKGCSARFFEGLRVLRHL
jgi:hypothetical protein